MILVTTPGNVRTRSHSAARSRSWSPATRTRSPGCGPVTEIAALIDAVGCSALVAELGSNRNPIYKTLFDARCKLRDALAANGHVGAGIMTGS